MPPFRKRTKSYWKKEKGCLCCRFPHSSRPVSLLDVAPKQKVTLDDAADRNNSARNGDRVRFHAHNNGPSSSSSPLDCSKQDGRDAPSPVGDPRCSTTFKMKRKKLKPSVARQVATIATSRAQLVAEHFMPEVRQAALEKLALVESEEINCGNLLGVGGFSLVYSIESVHLQCTSIDQNLYGEQGKVLSGLSFCRSHFRYTEVQKSARRLLAARVSSPPFQEIIERDKNLDRRVDRLSYYGYDDARIVTTRPIRTGRNTCPTNQSLYAIKYLKPELMNFPEKFAKAAVDLAREAEFLLCLDHPHIVKLHGLPCFGSSAYRCGEHQAFFFVMDRLVETLHDRVYDWRERVQGILHECPPSKEFKTFPMRARVQRLFNGWLPLAFRRTSSTENNNEGKETSLPFEIQERLDHLFLERIRAACDIASAIQYIHDQRIIHRDIKTTNIGLDHHGVVKVFDFGLARHLPEPTIGTTCHIDECFCMSNVGTKRYCAPEVSGKRYNLKSDVYSFGVVLWEILTLNSPQKPPRQSAVSCALLDTRKLRSCPCWPVIIQRLVFQMQDHDYRERPTIGSVRKTLSSFLESVAHQPVIADAGDLATTAMRLGSYRKSITSVDSSTIFDERFKLRASRSIAALIDDQQTVLSSSLMGMSISTTHP